MLYTGIKQKTRDCAQAFTALLYKLCMSFMRTVNLLQLKIVMFDWYSVYTLVRWAVIRHFYHSNSRSQRPEYLQYDQYDEQYQYQRKHDSDGKLHVRLSDDGGCSILDVIGEKCIVFVAQFHFAQLVRCYIDSVSDQLKHYGPACVYRPLAFMIGHGYSVNYKP